VPVIKPRMHANELGPMRRRARGREGQREIGRPSAVCRRGRCERAGQSTCDCCPCCRWPRSISSRTLRASAAADRSRRAGWRWAPT
jgi:hypothetical protein